MSNPRPLYQLRVCDGPSCGVTYESERLVEQIEHTIQVDPQLRGRVGVCTYTCFGRCEEGPNMFVHEIERDDERYEDPSDEALEQQRGFYPDLDPDKLARVLREHCGEGKPVEKLVDKY